VIRVYDAAGSVIEMHEQKGEFKEWGSLRDSIHRELVNRPFQFQKRSQLCVGVHNETLTVTVSVSNPDCSPARIYR
jgi:hypothetical protein